MKKEKHKKAKVGINWACKVGNCILGFYYMARACKYITRAVIGQYSGLELPMMPMGIYKRC